MFDVSGAGDTVIAAFALALAAGAGRAAAAAIANAAAGVVVGKRGTATADGRTSSPARCFATHGPVAHRRTPSSMPRRSQRLVDAWKAKG